MLNINYMSTENEFFKGGVQRDGVKERERESERKRDELLMILLYFCVIGLHE